MTTAQDPLVSAYGSLARWCRGRQLVLAAILLMAGLVVGLELRRSAEEPASEPAQPSATGAFVPVTPDRAWTHYVPPWLWFRYQAPQFEPRIESREGTWFARDLMGLERMELRVDDEPASSELAVREWAERLCGPQPRTRPRPLYLIDFDDCDTVDALSELLVDACPSLRIYWVSPWPAQCPGPGALPVY